MTLPKFTTPLVKALRTSEGILIYLVNLVLGIGTVIDPSKLPPSLAAIVVGVLTVAHLIARTGIKAIAIQQQVGLEPPVDPQALIDQVSSEVAKGVGGGVAGVGIEDLRNLIELAVSRGVKAGGITDNAPVPPAPAAEVVTPEHGRTA